MTSSCAVETVEHLMTGEPTGRRDQHLGTLSIQRDGATAARMAHGPRGVQGQQHYEGFYPGRRHPIHPESLGAALAMGSTSQLIAAQTLG